jgi:hypothetical protein
MDFRETFREIWHGCIYIYDKVRGKEPTLDVGARRVAHYEGAFGRTRKPRLIGGKPADTTNNLRKDSKVGRKDPSLPAVPLEAEETVDEETGGEKQWLGLGDNYRYRIGKRTRDISDGLPVQIERELQKRGHGRRMLCLQPFQFVSDDFHMYVDRRYSWKRPHWCHTKH